MASNAIVIPMNTSAVMIDFRKYSFISNFDLSYSAKVIIFCEMESRAGGLVRLPGSVGARPEGQSAAGLPDARVPRMKSETWRSSCFPAVAVSSPAPTSLPTAVALRHMDNPMKVAPSIRCESDPLRAPGKS